MVRYIYDPDGRDIIGSISGLNNIIDVIEYVDSPGVSVVDFYFLTQDGYVYNCKGSDLIEKNILLRKLMVLVVLKK